MAPAHEKIEIPKEPQKNRQKNIKITNSNHND